MCRDLHKICFLDELVKLCPLTNNLNPTPSGEIREVGPITVGVKAHGIDLWKGYAWYNPVSITGPRENLTEV